MHFKWQFVAWKMHRAGIIQLVGQRTDQDPLGAEVMVMNQKKDFGGSIDNIIYLPDEDYLFTLDWKSANANNFIRMVSDGQSLQYKIQSTAYASLANHDKTLSLPRAIDEVMIVSENKNGPVNNEECFVSSWPL